MTLPRRIGRYEIEREIGHGGMSMVYLARDPHVKRQVAIKILPRQFTHDPQFRARFQREAELVAALEHPHIVSLYDFGEEDEQPYIVMRYMPGGTLRERITVGPLPLKDLSRLVARVAEALDEAHSRHVIHRDLKPANILYDNRSEAYLSDFGIAKISESSAFTNTGIIGTPEYMSPEQARGDKVLDRRSDVYSLGVVFYHALTGQLPFKADTPMGAAVAHITEPIPNVLAVKPDLPEAWGEVVRCVLAKAPDHRYPTAGEFAQNVARAIAGQPVATSQAIAAPATVKSIAVNTPTIIPERLSAIKQMRRMRGHNGAISSLSFSPDSRTLVSGSVDKTAKVWDISYGRVLYTFARHTDAVRGVAYHPAGHTIVSGGRDAVVTLWNASTGLPRHVVQLKSGVSCLAFNADGQVLAAGGEALVYLLNPENGEVQKTFSGHAGRVSSVAVSPDGRTIISGGLDGALRMWSTGGLTSRFRPSLETRRVNYIWSVAFSPDGRWLAAGADSTLLVWDWSTGKLAFNFKSTLNTVSSLAFSPDGRLLVSGDADAMVRFWDPQTGEQLGVLRGHLEEVTSVAFSPDGYFLASASADDIICIWGLREP